MCDYQDGIEIANWENMHLLDHKNEYHMDLKAHWQISNRYRFVANEDGTLAAKGIYGDLPRYVLRFSKKATHLDYQVSVNIGGCYLKELVLNAVLWHFIQDH